MNRQQLFATYLKQHGWHEERSTSGKYRTFACDGHDTKYFLGKCGAIRKGRCASKSHSITDNVNWPAVEASVNAEAT